MPQAHTGHGLRLLAEIAAGRRGFPAANEIGDLYSSYYLRTILCSASNLTFVSEEKLDIILEQSYYHLRSVLL